MKRLKLYLKMALLNSFLILGNHLCSQELTDSSLITVKADVIAEGAPKFHLDTNCFFVIATITNTQDTSVNFWIMTCSWPVDNWIVDRDSIYLRFYGCDNNFPIEISLLPHRSISFYGALKPRIKHSLENVNFRLGFLYFASSAQLESYLERKIKKNNVKKYWSNQMKLEDNLLKYKIETF